SPRSNVCSTPDPENPSASVHPKRFSTPSLTLKFLCAGKLNPRGFSILQLSDLHIDLSVKAMERLHQILPSLTYDICVFTGDYRGQTFGPYQAALTGMSSLCRLIHKPMYGVLGNHDTIRMLPALEEMGI